MNVDVVLPVLDEAGSLPQVLTGMPDGFHPIVVDNGSTDGSAEIARRLGAQVISERRRGFGAACFAGLVAATGDVVCFMDCDGSLDSADLPLVATPVERGDADLMLGTRLANYRAWPLHARLANRALAWEVRRRYHVSLRDIGPMRAVLRRELLALGVTDRRFGWPLEMVIRAARRGWRIAEVPVAYQPRTAGRSKVTGTIRGTARAVIDMAKVL